MLLRSAPEKRVYNEALCVSYTFFSFSNYYCIPVAQSKCYVLGRSVLLFFIFLNDLQSANPIEKARSSFNAKQFDVAIKYCRAGLEVSNNDNTLSSILASAVVLFTVVLLFVISFFLLVS